MKQHWSKPKLIESASLDVRLSESQPQIDLTETLDDGTVVGWHAHEFAQVLNPEQGAVALFVRDWLSIVPQSHAAYIRAGVMHTVVANTHASLRTICIQHDDPGLSGLDASRPLIRKVVPALSGDHDAAVQDRLIRTFTQTRAISTDEADVRLNQFLAGVPVPQDRRARPIAFRLVSALHDQRTLKEWGEVLGASERTLTRIFRDETGMSFRSWRLRLQVAATIALLFCGRSVKSASSAAGYASPSAFVSAFHAATGQSPLEYIKDASWD
ncbi:AraC family transcriptional regulator [Caballeronia sp. LZ035]|uniref:helix-turn-helix domain-containing protein n=1 Tax=Caballeronia sp. LZ035 TaxID=3038568 RepID=UPI002862FA26|nr:AraC family transcriptional regulator [Caballeronia sp. LZ035]MDR5761410.1 AraC family transcriptional regulator [Caballeronia sp. LZ035]